MDINELADRIARPPHNWTHTAAINTLTRRIEEAMVPFRGRAP